MRLIGADALMELARNHVNRSVDCNDIARFPTVDAEPVVRCKDCKHRGTCNCPMLQEIELYDEYNGWDYRDIDNTDDDGFCHKGAKMDGGTEKDELQ